jgi:hypothetical protein
MPVRATVHPLSEPGHALLRLTDLDAHPEGLSLSIERQQGPDSHLADDGWRRTEAWLVPADVRRNRNVLELQLGPEICDRLAGIATIRLRVREPDIGVVGSTVVAWPSMLTSGAVSARGDATDDTVHLRRVVKPPVEEPPPPPPAEEPAAPKPMPELRAVREPAAEKRGSGGWILATIAAILITAGGAYAYWHLTREEVVPVATAPQSPALPPSTSAQASKKSIRETVAEFIATKPAPAAMMATARNYAQSGDLDGAFLVWRHAAEAGDAQAQLELAAYYDPLATPPRAGFAPDGVRAADWYERAALAGLPEAQRKYGMLLTKGGAGLPADLGKARSWLQQAAAQNDAEAKKALDALPK